MNWDIIILGLIAIVPAVLNARYTYKLGQKPAMNGGFSGLLEDINKIKAGMGKIKKDVFKIKKQLIVGKKKIAEIETKID